MIINVANEDYEIKYTEDGSEITRAILQQKPRFITYDTETDGLHLKKARPFWGAVCVKNTVYVFPTNYEVLKHMKAWAAQTKRIYAHNTLFDMNMTANVVGDDFIKSIKNWGDTMALIRLTTEAISAGKEGGMPLGLKKVSKLVIDKEADKYEKAVKEELKRLGAGHRKILAAMLKELQKRYGLKKAITLSIIDNWRKNVDDDEAETLDDLLTERFGGEITDSCEQINLAEDVEKLYNEWLIECKPPTYEDVDREIMLPYLATDVIYTKIIVERALPKIVEYQQTVSMSREWKLIPVTFEMTRQGLPVDREYLQQSLEKMNQYITDTYNELYEILGEKVNVNQHKKIKELFEKILHVPLGNCDKKRLKKFEKLAKEKLGYTVGAIKKICGTIGYSDPESMIQNMPKEEKVAMIDHINANIGKVAKASNLIARLRRFTKWRSVYINRILEGSEYDGRYYASMNPYNPVSGRFSGDIQQFPKDPIYTAEGYAYENETGHKPPKEMILYHPRRAFIGNMVFIDWSQVELRLQAHYTLAFGGDLNLCRAYMPYRCKHYKTGEWYDFSTVEGRGKWKEFREGYPTDKHWEDVLADGWSVWVIPETNEVWKPTDLHSQTSLNALKFLNISPSELTKDDLKSWRNRGKTTNFAKNYGSGAYNIAETLDVSLEVGTALSDGYNATFPLVLKYQEEIYNAMMKRGYVVNMFGRRYYGSDKQVFYRFGNYIIQGSGADLLKEKMIACQEFIEAKGLKTRVLLCVHDEIGFSFVKGEEWAIAEFKRIMEDVPMCKVPIVAEVDYTETYWSEKMPLAV